MVYELHRQNGALEDVAHIDAVGRFNPGTCTGIVECSFEAALEL
jgi:hypothetical protein